MAGRVDVDVQLRDAFFSEYLHGPEIAAVRRAVAEKAKGITEAIAPEDTGAYKRGLEIRVGTRFVGRRGSRPVEELHATDPSSLPLEFGNDRTYGEQRPLGKTLIELEATR